MQQDSSCQDYGQILFWIIIIITDVLMCQQHNKDYQLGKVENCSLQGL